MKDKLLEKASKIHKHDYVDELEDQVRSYMDVVIRRKVNDKKYERLIIPEFTNDSKRIGFENEQIERCINGYDGMCGKTYFWFHFCKIQNYLLVDCH